MTEKTDKPILKVELTAKEKAVLRKARETLLERMPNATPEELGKAFYDEIKNETPLYREVKNELSK